MSADRNHLPLMGASIIPNGAAIRTLEGDPNQLLAFILHGTPAATTDAPAPEETPEETPEEREQAIRLDDEDPRSWPDSLREKVASRRLEQHSQRHTCMDAADWLDENDEPDEPIIAELIEKGEMFAIVGQSKAGKSLLALQMAVCVATGRDFIGRHVVRNRVYLANLEVSRKQYKKRLRHLCRTLCIDLSELRGWLFIDNMKGDSTNWQWLRDEAKIRGAALVVIDPFYQVFEGAETHEEDCMKAVDEMKKFQNDGLTLGIVFHSPKGFSGDRQLIDMISGSSVLARFPESIFGILNHASDNAARVIDCELRNYAKPDPFVVKFTDGAFVTAPDLSPDVKSSGKKLTYKSPEERKRLKDEAYDKEQASLRDGLDKVLSAAGGKPLAATLVKEKLMGMHFGKHAVEDFLKAREAAGEIVRQEELIEDGDKRGSKKSRRDGGRVFIMTPVQREIYLTNFEMLQI